MRSPMFGSPPQIEGTRMMRSRTGTTRLPFAHELSPRVVPVPTIEIIGENWPSEAGTTHSRAPEARELSPYACLNEFGRVCHVGSGTRGYSATVHLPSSLSLLRACQWCGGVRMARRPLRLATRAFSGRKKRRFNRASCGFHYAGRNLSVSQTSICISQIWFPVAATA